MGQGEVMVLKGRQDLKWLFINNLNLTQEYLKFQWKTLR